MSYPEPRYHGDTGEVSATYRAADQSPEVAYPNGNTVHYLATGEATHRLFGLYRWEFGTEPSGLDPHFHRTLTESFYILTGTVRASTTARAGSTRCRATSSTCPRAGSTASGMSRVRCVHAHPLRRGAAEGYFEGLAEFARSGTRPDELAEFYRLHDNVWLKE